MAWQADASTTGIGPGTILTLTFTPHIAGLSSPTPQVGDKITVATVVNVRTSATVIEASAQGIVIEMRGGARWKMTPRTAHDGPFPNVNTGSTPSQDWIIRSPG
jgi:hypothetical protein